MNRKVTANFSKKHCSVSRNVSKYSYFLNFRNSSQILPEIDKILSWTRNNFTVSKLAHIHISDKAGILSEFKLYMIAISKICISLKIYIISKITYYLLPSTRIFTKLFVGEFSNVVKKYLLASSFAKDIVKK